MRIALVHDYLIERGGAEQVLEAFLEIWPKAPIYTLLYDEKLTHGRFKGRRIYTSFLQKLPFSRSHHRLFPLLMPFAAEQFDLSKYDVVLSDSASYAKGIVTKPSTLHVSYCHTPIRYAWDDSHKYIEEFYYPSLVKKFIPFFMNYIRIWDREAANRVDYFIANSKFVQRRIKKYYGADSEVVYPPVNVSNFSAAKLSLADGALSAPARKDSGKYFLMVGRLLPYKRFDIAIEAFNSFKQPLKIIGRGPAEKGLRFKAKTNVEFLKVDGDEKLSEYLAGAKALIFPQEEDFGITAVEAMACGKPVIAFKSGGALETVKEGVSGLFFEEQTPAALIKALEKFERSAFEPELVRQEALKFDKEIFKKKIREFVEKKWKAMNQAS